MRKFVVKTIRLWNKAPNIKQEINIVGTYDNYPRARFEAQKILDKYYDDMNVYKIMDIFYNIWAVILDGEVICIRVEEE